MLMKMLTDSSIPFNLVLTKADKMPAKGLENRFRKVIDEVLAKGTAGAVNPIVHLTSTHTGYGVEELMSDMVFVLE